MRWTIGEGPTPSPRWGRALGPFVAARRLVPGLALLAILLPMTATAAPDPAMCRLECGAQFVEPAQNPVSVQTCLVRCAARAAALGSANVTAATIMPMPQTPWTGGPGGNRAAPEPARPAARRTAAQERREAARARRAAAQAAPAATARPAQASLPASSMVTSLIGAQGAVPAAAQDGVGGFGAIHLAPAPSRNYGLVVGAADRLAAHRAAEAACLGAAGTACRTAADFTDRCAAVAHALRNRGALVMTDHPSTFIVTGAATGTGSTREEAEREAARACAVIGRGSSCQITAARCAG